MKKSSLITVTVAAMMGLVACNNSSAPEKKWTEEISNQMVELFGEALPYVDLNAETLYSGVDATYATWPYGVYIYYIGDDNETNLLANYGDKLVAAGYKLESDEDGDYYTKTINDSTVSVSFEYIPADAEKEIDAGNEIQVAYSGEMIYGGEGNIVASFVASFFDEDAVDYVEAGDEAVYDGTDEAGNPVYTGGASFDNVVFTTKDETDPKPKVIEDYFDIVAYSEAKEDPETSEVTYEDPYMVEFGDLILAQYGFMMMNMTDRMISEKYQQYVVEYVEDQPVLYLPGSALLGVYAFYVIDEEFNPLGVYLLDVEFDQLNLTVEQLSTYFTPAGVQQISEQGYFDDDGVISIVLESVSCVYIDLQEDVPTDPAE